MSKTDRAEIQELHRQMDTYRSIIKRNNGRLEHDIWLEKQIRFWMESTRFLITELEIWDRLGNETKCVETTSKAQKALDTLYDLLRQLD